MSICLLFRFGHFLTTLYNVPTNLSQYLLPQILWQTFLKKKLGNLGEKCVFSSAKFTHFANVLNFFFPKILISQNFFKKVKKTPSSHINKCINTHPQHKCFHTLIQYNSQVGDEEGLRKISTPFKLWAFNIFRTMWVQRMIATDFGHSIKYYHHSEH